MGKMNNLSLEEAHKGMPDWSQATPQPQQPANGGK